MKRISFAAVGSGINFYNNSEVITSPGYKKFALASYSLYSKYILNRDLNIEILNDDLIISKLKKLDKLNWKIVD
jgi:hypothetical protein